MTRRSRAREVALQLLYADDLNPQRDLHAADQLLQQRLQFDERLVEFARGLVSGVRRNRAELDQWLGSLARNWTLGRMAVIDRNILRLAGFEILFTETPGQVVINEAVELAKRFGGRQSPPFVNGVLDRLLKESRKNRDNDGTSGAAADR